MSSIDLITHDCIFVATGACVDSMLVCYSFALTMDWPTLCCIQTYLDTIIVLFGYINVIENIALTSSYISCLNVINHKFYQWIRD